jgi:hypothetical protein
VSIASRVATRYLKAKVMDRAQAEEVLSVQIRGKSVADHINAFLLELIKNGREIEKIVEAGAKEVEGYYPPDKMNWKELERVVYKHLVEGHWTKDDMAKPLSKLITHGDYVH